MEEKLDKIIDKQLLKAKGVIGIHDAYAKNENGYFPVSRSPK